MYYYYTNNNRWTNIRVVEYLFTIATVLFELNWKVTVVCFVLFYFEFLTSSNFFFPLDILHSLSHARVEYLNACALSPFANIHLLRLDLFSKFWPLSLKNSLQSLNITRSEGVGNHFPVYTLWFLSLLRREFNGKLSTAYLYTIIGWIISEWLINLYNKLQRKNILFFSIIFLYLKLLIWLIDFVE